MHSASRGVLLVLVVLAAGACTRSGKPTPTGPGGGSAAPAGSLAASLEGELGRPVAILPSAEGLLAVSADGAKKRVLVPPPVAWALVDNRAGGVWFGPRDAIRFLDLTVATPTPEDIVTGLPTDVIEGAPGFTFLYGDQVAGELEIGHPAYHKIILKLDAEPDLMGDPGAWTDDEEFPVAVEGRPITPAVRARLVELWRRGEGRALALAAPETPVGPLTTVDKAGCPDDEDMCGSASVIPGTKLWRVVVGFGCGDGCHASYAVYDPATKAYVEAPWTEQVQMAWLTPDGTTLVRNGTITRLDARGVVFTGGDEVEGGGWLGEAYYIPW